MRRRGTGRPRGGTAPASRSACRASDPGRRLGIEQLAGRPTRRQRRGDGLRPRPAARGRCSRSARAAPRPGVVLQLPPERQRLLGHAHVAGVRVGVAGRCGRPPWLLPRSWPASNCSASTTSWPRRASHHTVDEPIAPPPITTASTSGRTLIVGYNVAAKVSDRSPGARGQQRHPAEQLQVLAGDLGHDVHPGAAGRARHGATGRRSPSTISTAATSSSPMPRAAQRGRLVRVDEERQHAGREDTRS